MLTTMGLFDFFQNKKKADVEKLTPVPEPIDKYEWTGKDFEFLITGDIEITAYIYDKIMTPNSLNWTKKIKDDWPYYEVGQDEFSYSSELAGIQMTFNKKRLYDKAKKIAEEVISNIKATGQDAELVELDKSKFYKC